jgi:hypothetical protein
MVHEGQQRARAEGAPKQQQQHVDEHVTAACNTTATAAGRGGGSEQGRAGQGRLP